jgi:hypothetical protein
MTATNAEYFLRYRRRRHKAASRGAAGVAL